jgi:type I restriction enzyme S subunit
MTSELRVFALEECLDALIDYRGKTPEKARSGVPLITAKIIKGGRIEEPTEFIAAEHYESWMRRGIPKQGDVVLTVEAPLGEVAQLGPGRVALAQRVVTLRGKSGVLDSTFLLYLLQSEQVQAALRERASGTTVLGIKQSELRKVKISVPNMEYQIFAAATLKSLDDRIALLRETNASLDAIARALFKSWFLDFDPVHAKLQGKSPAGSDASTAAMFPCAFETVDLRELPVGWQLQRVDELMELAYGKALTASDRTPGPVPVYGSGGITGSHNLSLVEGPSVVVGRKGTVGSLYWEDRPFFPIDTVFYVRPRVELTFAFYLLGTLGLETMNTDGAVPGLNRSNVYGLKCVVPPKSLRVAFDDFVRPIRMSIFVNNQQAETLMSLRDTLLPRLISGQSLPEAQGSLAEAESA